MFHEVLLEVKRLEKRYTELGSHQKLADVLIAKVRALWMLLRLEESLEVINQCEYVLTHLEQPEEAKKRRVHLIRYKGAIYGLKHDLKRSMEYYQQSLVLAEEMFTACDLGVIFHNKKRKYLEGGSKIG